MNFGFALESLKSGRAVARKGWNGNGLIVKLQAPDEHSKMSLPYLYIEYPMDAKITPGARCPWLPSATDLMADDWYSEGGAQPSIEQEIQVKGLTAPRVTPQRIEEVIDGEYYFTAKDGVCYAFGKQDAMTHACGYHKSVGLLTFCVLVLKNGFTVTGESACASPENFDAEVGRKIARENAVNKVWMLEGYLLKQRLHEEKPA
ncbi:Gp49 family protein [Aeromonas sp. A5]|uniref:Gp49 family protein n=1 Tax=unclassified Aeromonas TaxID=257493 RepID=UPI00376FB010